MDLKELAAITGEVKVEATVPTDADVEFESDKDLEQELVDSLSLLEDCQILLNSLLVYRETRKLSVNMFDEIKRLSDETCWHLAQYDADGELSGNI